MNLLATLGLGLLLWGPALPAAQAPTSIFKEADIKSAVSSLAYLLCDATSMEDDRLRAVVHHTGPDGQESLAVFFTLEGQGGGGMGYLHYLAVFTCENFGLEGVAYRPTLLDYKIVGGKWMRELDGEGATLTQKGQTLSIEVDTQSCGPKDLPGEPSIEGKARFSISLVPGGKLSEVPVQPKRKPRHY